VNSAGAWCELHNNHTDVGDRQMQNIFAAFARGPIAWLGEVDYIDDESLLAEAQAMGRPHRGRLEPREGPQPEAHGREFDPDADIDEDEQCATASSGNTYRSSSPSCAGYRYYDGIPQNDRQNRQLVFLQFNGYF